MLIQDEKRDRLARWMGWSIRLSENRTGVWCELNSRPRAQYEDWLNPPTEDQAMMLLENARKLGMRYMLQGNADGTWCVLWPLAARMVNGPIEQHESWAIVNAVLAMLEVGDGR